MKVGDKLICIDSSPGRETGVNALIKNAIYTVYMLRERSVLLEEEPSGYWDKKRFRPIEPIDLWNESEQEIYLEWIEQLSPGVETVEK